MSVSWKHAIAYLRPNLTADERSPNISLNREESPVLRDLHNGLLVAYVVGDGPSFSYIQYRHLDVAGVNEGELHTIVIDNLYSLAERHLRIQPHGNVFALFMDGNFEASLLLLDTVWEVSFAKHVRGDFVAAIPARDVLAFADSANPRAIAELHDAWLIRRYRESEIGWSAPSDLSRWTMLGCQPPDSRRNHRSTQRFFMMCSPLLVI